MKKFFQDFEDFAAEYPFAYMIVMGLLFAGVILVFKLIDFVSKL